MLALANLRISAFRFRVYDISWEVAPTAEDVLGYEFAVFRSESPAGPYDQISGWFVDKYRFADTGVPNYASSFRRLFYQIGVRKRGEEAASFFPEEGLRLQAAPDLIALEMARQERVRMKFMRKGRQMWILPRRHFGTRCHICYDVVTKKTLRSDCRACFATGFTRGYLSPIEVWGQIGTAAEANFKTPQGSLEVADSVLLLPNFPELDAGDLIVDAENTRWSVSNTINKVKHARSLIRQQAQVHPLPTTRIEYLVPFTPPDDVADTAGTALHRYAMPQTLEQDQLALNTARLFRM